MLAVPAHDHDTPHPDERIAVRDWLDSHASGPMAHAALRLLHDEDRVLR